MVLHDFINKVRCAYRPTASANAACFKHMWYKHLLCEYSIQATLLSIKLINVRDIACKWEFPD